MTTAEALTPHVTATQFLGEVFRDVDEGWIHAFTIDRTTGDRRTAWAPAARPGDLALEASRMAERGCVWFGPATRGANLGANRGGSADCVVITAIWVDIDVAGARHVATDLPPTKDDARRLLDDFPLTPSAVVDTGGGLQAWWLLAEPLDAEDAVVLLARWGATWAELGAHRRWHVDNVFDLARVMRLPGTWNRKEPADPVLVTVTAWRPELRYGPDDIDQWCIDPPKPPVAEVTAQRAVPYIGPERPGDAFNAAVNPGALWERRGFVLDHVDRDGGAHHYRAPHHAAERGSTGLTVYADGHSTLWSDTFAAQSGMRTKRPYDAFGVYTWLEHHGDWRAASDELARRGYGTKAVQIAPSSLVAATPAQVDDAPADDDWAPIDLAPIAARIRNGTHEPTVPVVLAVDGALPLFYAERINSLFGESGGGKTWVALAAVAEVARARRRALLVDYEDNANGIAERLVLLGLDDDEIACVDYVNPSTGIGLGIDAVAARAIELVYGIVVIDSTGEAMAAGGVDSNADREVAQWFALVKRLCRMPGAPAVVVLDHVPKDREAPSAYAIGSQRKRAAVTGAAYRVDTIKEPAKGRDGKLKLTVAKDRPGNRAKGTTAAIVDVRSGDGVELHLHVSDATAATEEGARFRPTVYMERVSRYLEDNPGAGRRTVQSEVVGKREHINSAIEVLVDEGWITSTPGARGATLLTVVRPFRDGLTPVDNPPVHRGPTAAPPRPGPRSDDPRTAAPGIHSQGPRAAVDGHEGTTDRGPVDNQSVDDEPRYDDSELF